MLYGDHSFALALLSLCTCPLGPNLHSPAELLGRKMCGTILNLNTMLEFVRGVDDDEIKHTQQKCQETTKCNFDRKYNVQQHTPLPTGTPVMVLGKEGHIWTYGIIIDVPKPNVCEGHCYKIELSSGRIMTRNSIHVDQTHVPAKIFLTDTDKQTEKTAYLCTEQSHLLLLQVIPIYKSRY